MTRFILLFCLLAGLGGPALAHKPSDSYLHLDLSGTALEGRWDIALRDLDFAIGLDGNGDGSITWGELRARHPSIASYALSHLRVSRSAGNCRLEPLDHKVVDHSDGTYAVLHFAGTCPAADGPTDVEYSLFFDLDPQHRGIARLAQDSEILAAVFSPERPVYQVADEGPSWAAFADFFREGVWHIWIGLDHILFLVTLLLPAVLMRRNGAWQALDDLPRAVVSVTKVVTAFTLAHSLTLAMAALEIVRLPSQLVESAIAASVILAALNNLWPLVTRRTWLVAFGFGLIHGFGFASVLADLGLPGEGLILALLGFNLGVEAGQLAIVLAVMPLAFALRGGLFYRRFALPAGSLGVALVAGVWLVERSLGLAVLGS